jgi:hypothetical protein
MCESSPAKQEPPADLQPLIYNAKAASKRLGGIISAFWLERRAAAAQIPCTYIGGHLGFAEPHLQWLIDAGYRDPVNYGRKGQTEQTKSSP